MSLALSSGPHLLPFHLLLLLDLSQLSSPKKKKKHFFGEEKDGIFFFFLVEVGNWWRYTYVRLHLPSDVPSLFPPLRRYLPRRCCVVMTLYTTTFLLPLCMCWTYHTNRGQTFAKGSARQKNLFLHFLQLYLAIHVHIFLDKKEKTCGKYHGT